MYCHNMTDERLDQLTTLAFRIMRTLEIEHSTPAGFSPVREWLVSLGATDAESYEVMFYIRDSRLNWHPNRHAPVAEMLPPGHDLPPRIYPHGIYRPKPARQGWQIDDDEARDMGAFASEWF